ncbi:hypothetical protein WJX73_009748 [Symbiochloris irregularis]|uniref:AAA+ ATPase domain-containing protein n=1 Tax=Symbiochloris irregularis TaxID=706552 RepID=A0AAW1NMW0_9CHLO
MPSDLNHTLDKELAALTLSSDQQTAANAPASQAAYPGSVKEPVQHTTLSTVAGLLEAQDALLQLIDWPTKYSGEAKQIGLRWPTGLLLHGPPGCGKSLVVRSVAAHCGAVVHPVTASAVYGAYLGESEQRLRELFEKAVDAAGRGQTIILFIDEADALCPVRHVVRPHEARVVAQLLTLIDSLAHVPDAGGKGRVCIVAATNRPNAIDPALRRPHRLDQEVAVGLPAAKDRESILRLHTAAMPLADDVDLSSVAARAHGFSGADLTALCREAAMRALTAASETLADLSVAEYDDSHKVTSADFAACLQHMAPSMTRGIDMDLDPVPWDDIGGLHDVKRQLRQAVEWPLVHAQAFQRLHITPMRGVLLHGPPGCCKTRLARAAAAASGARLHSLNGAQVLSAYVGEGEARLRGAFARARAVAPTILFLDELDALVGRREEGSQGAGGQEAVERLLSVLLTEMDGLERCTGVLVLAATNRPHAIDAALLRPGRFDALLYVPPPDLAGRVETLRIHTRSMPLANDVDLHALAEATELYTGAELEGMCAEAALAALREDLQGASSVSQRHFEAAMAGMRPGLTPAKLQQYAAWDPRRPASVPGPTLQAMPDLRSWPIGAS